MLPRHKNHRKKKDQPKVASKKLRLLMFGGSDIFVQYRPRGLLSEDKTSSLIIMQDYPVDAKSIEKQAMEIMKKPVGATKTENIIQIPNAEIALFTEGLKKGRHFHDFMIYIHMECNKTLAEVAKHYKDKVGCDGRLTHSKQDIYNYTVYKYHVMTAGTQVRDVPIKMAMKQYLKKHENEAYAIPF